MKYRLLSVIAISVVSISTTFSQNENSVSDTLKKNKGADYSKRLDPKSTSVVTESSAQPVLTPATPVSLSGRTTGTAVGAPSETVAPKPATRMSDPNAVTSAKYTVNSSVSILDNLVGMLELKDKVNATPNNDALRSSSDYTELNSNITLYRANFENYIVTKGFENCSVREQNYFLSFLKDENRMPEYNLYLSKLN